MAQETLVKEHIEHGWNLAVEFNRQVASVNTAFWARTNEEQKWYLYLVTGAVDAKGLSGAYRAVLAVYEKMPRSALSRFDVKLISPNEFISGWVSFKLNDARFLNTVVTCIQPPIPGNIHVDAIYVYPPLPQLQPGVISMTHDEVKKTVLDLLNRKGSPQPSTVKLQDGSSFQGVPFGIEVSNDLMNVKFIDDVSHLPRIVPVDQIVSIC
jgi:hypothetical protein